MIYHRKTKYGGYLPISFMVDKLGSHVLWPDPFVYTLYTSVYLAYFIYNLYINVNRLNIHDFVFDHRLGPL